MGLYQLKVMLQTRIPIPVFWFNKYSYNAAIAVKELSAIGNKNVEGTVWSEPLVCSAPSSIGTTISGII